jgi:hypothetical protein
LGVADLLGGAERKQDPRELGVCNVRDTVEELESYLDLHSKVMVVIAAHIKNIL